MEAAVGEREGGCACAADIDCRKASMGPCRKGLCEVLCSKPKRLDQARLSLPWRRRASPVSETRRVEATVGGILENGRAPPVSATYRVEAAVGKTLGVGFVTTTVCQGFGRAPRVCKASSLWESCD